MGLSAASAVGDAGGGGVGGVASFLFRGILLSVSLLVGDGGGFDGSIFRRRLAAAS